MLQYKRSINKKTNKSSGQANTLKYQTIQSKKLQKIYDITSNGQIIHSLSSSSQKKTTHTDASSIKCKKINNKEINLRTEPLNHKTHDVQQKYIFTRNNDKDFEHDTFALTINYTNRKPKNHKHIATQVFNNTGKYSNQTQNKFKQLDDIIALQSKTTTRKTKNSHPNIFQSQKHSRAPSLILKSPKKIKQKCKLSKSSQKYSIKKPILVAPAQSEKKVKVRKPSLNLQLQKIQKTVLAQVLEISNFSLGQHSKSEPDLFHRMVQSKQIQIQSYSKDDAASLIKKYWVQYKQKAVLKLYKNIFSKKQQSTPAISTRSQKKSVTKIPSFDLNGFQRGFQQPTISQHIDDSQILFNVNKYVKVQPKQQQQQMIQIKKKNKKLQKQLQKFKQKQLNLCEQFQNALLSSSDIKAQQLLQLVKAYKTEVVFDKKSSTSSIMSSYKQLIEQNGIAQKIYNNKNALTKYIMDNEETLLKHKHSSKSLLLQDHESYSFNTQQHKQPDFISPQISNPQNKNNIQTNKLLCTYLDCQLQNFDYQKQDNKKINDLITESINNQILDFNKEQTEIKENEIPQMMCQLAKTQQFHQSLVSTLIQQFCEDAINSPSIMQNLHEMKQLRDQYKGLQTKVSLPDIVDYLRGLIEFLMKNKKIMKIILENINKTLGSTSSELLYYLRPNMDENFQCFGGENPYNFVIPMGVFEDFENINRQLGGQQNQQALLIHYFWHRSLYQLFNQLLDKKRPYGIQGQPYAWNNNLNSNKSSINFEKLNKIFQATLNQILEIITFPTGLMFDSPLCQYYQCQLTYQDKIKINQDRMWLILCQQIVQQEPIYQNFNDEKAEVTLNLAQYITELIMFQVVTDYRKISRQRFLLSL